MKSWTLSDELRARPELAAAIERLRPVVGESILQPYHAPEVSAAWRLEADRAGRDRVVLRLADDSWPAGVEEGFTPGELDTAGGYFRTGVLLLADELLGRANAVRIERLLEVGAD